MLERSRWPKYAKVTLESALDARVGDIPLGRTAPIVALVALDPAGADDHDTCAVLADGSSWKLHRRKHPETVMRPCEGDAADEPERSLAAELARVSPEEARALYEALDFWASSAEEPRRRPTVGRGVGCELLKRLSWRYSTAVKEAGAEGEGGVGEGGFLEK